MMAVCGEGDVYVQHFRRQKHGTIVAAMENQWVGQDGAWNGDGDEAWSDGGNPGEEHDEDDEREQAEWEKKEQKRATARESRQKKKEQKAAMKAMLDDQDGDDNHDVDDGDGGDGGWDDDIHRGDGVLFEKHDPSPGSILACFTDMVQQQRGHAPSSLEAAVPCANQPRAPDQIILWLCSGDYKDGEDGVRYLGGHLLNPAAGVNMVARYHETGESLPVRGSDAPRNQGFISGARVFAVDIESTADTEHTKKCYVPAKEFRSVLRMGMAHIGRVVGVLPPAEKQDTETVLLFLITREDDTDAMHGFWLEEVVNERQGTGHFWVGDAGNIEEANILERPRLGRDYGLRMQLADTIHVHQGFPHLLWTCSELQQLEQLGGAHIAKPGHQKAKLILAGMGVRNR